jgi:hypothetical protein
MCNNFLKVKFLLINLMRIAKSDKQLEKLELMKDDWNKDFIPTT